MGKKSIAGNSQEFREKYGRKRYTQKNIGVAFVALRLYGLFLKNEGVSTKEIPEGASLFTKATMHKHAIILSELEGEDLSRCQSYSRMLDICWAEFRYTVLVQRLTLKGLQLLSYLAADTLTAEEMNAYTAAKGEEPPEDIGQHFKQILSAEAFKEGGRRHKTFDSTRTDIEANLRYILAHNTFIELVADAFGIPELTILKVSVENLDRMLSTVNGIVLDAREKLKEEDQDAPVAVFRDRLFDITPAPPIPEELIKRLASDLKRRLRAEDCLSNLLNCYYSNGGMDAYAYG